MGLIEEFLEILEPVGSTTDVEDNLAMEKSVEDRCGDCLVAGEDPASQYVRRVVVFE